MFPRYLTPLGETTNSGMSMDHKISVLGDLDADRTYACGEKGKPNCCGNALADHPGGVDCSGKNCGDCESALKGACGTNRDRDGRKCTAIQVINQPSGCTFKDPYPCT